MAEQTMIERMARALSGLAGNVPEADWRSFEPTARALLLAIREPSEPMRVAGADFFEEGDAKMNRFAGEIVYQAMIDAALAEGAAAAE